MKELRACKSCSLLGEEQTCPRCGGQTSKEWQGYIAILDASKSEIAKKMNITQNGKYALRVR
jgi:DNA-directed RNA polymerase subunit E"